MTPEETRLTFFDVVQKDDFRESVIKRLQSNSQGKVVTFPIVFPKLYKYRPLSKYAVADLKGQRMTATSIGCFNDLFDGAIHLYGTKEERRVASEQKWRDLQASLQKIGLSPEIVSHEPFVNTYESMFEEEERLKFRALEFLGTYVVCLSTKKDSILMWSHYADSQQGICIEYDLNQWDADSPQRKLLFPVLYTDEPVNTSELFDKDAYTISKYPVDEAVLCAAINKASVWNYENEWRLVYVTLSCDSQNQRIPVDVSIQPTAIYLGYHFLKPFFYYDTDDRKAYECARENLLTFNELMEFIIGNRIPLYLMRPAIGRYHLNSVPLDANQLMALIAEHVDAPQEMRYYHTVQDMLIRSLPV